MMQNEYTPFLSEILEVKKHTDLEYTFRMAYKGSVKPGQFFEVSIPKFGEAPISISGMGDGYVELTIRKVGKVTNEILERYKGDRLFLRGPYGNGFDVNDYKNKDLVIVAGGTGVSPVRGVIDYFYNHRAEVKSLTVIAGFKTPSFILFSEDFKKWEDRIGIVLTVDKSEEKDECKSSRNTEGKDDSKNSMNTEKSLNIQSSDISQNKMDSKDSIEGKNSLKYREGLVTKYIPEIYVHSKKEAAAIVVGPPMMMRFAVESLLQEGYLEENIWISHERKMCCGIGKCGHCKIDDTYVCLDGPVFPFTKGRLLVD